MTMTYAELFTRILFGQARVLFGTCCPAHGILQMHVNAYQIAFDAVTDEGIVAVVTADKRSGEIEVQFAEVAELPEFEIL